MDISFFANRTPRHIGEATARHSAVCILLLERSETAIHLKEGDVEDKVVSQTDNSFKSASSKTFPPYDILFSVRSSEIGTQPGDVCFPGGKLEPGETPEEAAVREAMEELLICKDQVELIGPADILASSNIYVHPFVCRLKDYQNTYSKDEITEVFRVPLEFFLTTEPTRYVAPWERQLPEDFPFDKIVGGRNYQWRKRDEEILFYEYEGHVIWGMTAKMVRAFAETLLEEMR